MKRKTAWCWTKSSNYVMTQVWETSAAIKWCKLQSSECWITLKTTCIPLVNTVLHGGQTNSLWGNRRGLESAWNPLFHQSTQYHRVVGRKTSDKTKHAGFRVQCRTLSSTSQHSTAWWSDRKLVTKEARKPLFHQSTQHHIVVREKASNE